MTESFKNKEVVKKAIEDMKFKSKLFKKREDIQSWNKMWDDLLERLGL